MPSFFAISCKHSPFVSHLSRLSESLKSPAAPQLTVHSRETTPAAVPPLRALPPPCRMRRSGSMSDRRAHRSGAVPEADGLGEMESALARDEGPSGSESNPLLGPNSLPPAYAAAGAPRRPRYIRLQLGPWQSPEVRPELVAISMVYLVQGLLGLSRLAVFTFFKDDLALDPATVGLLTSLGYAPWVVKPLYGFLSDSVPLWGYRRRSYLVLCGIMGSAAWAGLASVAASPPAAVTALALGSLSTACADVVADSIVVELSRGESQGTAGSLQSLCWASASAGSVLSAYFSGSLVQIYGPRPVFWMTAAFPLLVSAAAAVIPEEPVSKRTTTTSSSMTTPISSSSAPAGTASSSGGFFPAQKTGSGGSSRAPSQPGSPSGPSVQQALRAQAAALWGALKQPSILLPTLFVFAWQATPTADTAMLFFETNELGFTTEFLGRISLVASIASLAGVGVFNFWLKDAPLRKIFLYTSVAGAGLGLTQLALITGFNRRLGMSNELFALGDSALLTVLGRVSFMPLLVLAARLCPEGVEATLFATLMSVLNAASFTGSALGAGLTSAFGVTSSNFDNLAPLVALCTLLGLAPLALLHLVPEGGAGEVERSGKEKDKE